jgi:GT2 family glycosyltransferase
MNTTFAIGIPTLNRLDLLHPALLFYINDFPNTKIFVVDNGKQGISARISHPNIVVIEREENLGVAGSWNLLCSEIFSGHENALILNDDIYLGKKEWDILNLLEHYKSDFYVTTQDWCAFMMPKKTFTKVGAFDIRFFPAYYEDNDYEYRMKLQGLKTMAIPFLNPFVFKDSMTMAKEPKLKELVQKNKEYFVSKWGGLPKKETFKKPFNQ